MKNTLGQTIASLRKQQGMTQLQLAEELNVTDKAVSKWERDLSCPDVHTLPRIAELFGVSVDELMQGAQENAQPDAEAPTQKEEPEWKKLIPLICHGVALAMGVAVTVLSILGQVDAKDAISMLAIGLIAIALPNFIKEK